MEQHCSHLLDTSVSPHSTANEVIPLCLLFLPRTVVRINKHLQSPVCSSEQRVSPGGKCCPEQRWGVCPGQPKVVCASGAVSRHKKEKLSSFPVSISHILGMEAWLGRLMGMNISQHSSRVTDSWGPWHVQVLQNQPHWGLGGERKSACPWVCQFVIRVEAMGAKKETLKQLISTPGGNASRNGKQA